CDNGDALEMMRFRIRNEGYDIGVRAGSWRFCCTALAGLFIAGGAIVYAQQIWFGGYGSTPPKFSTQESFVGGFNFCRVMFSSNRREKRGWDTDYPGADINFSIRLSELTKAHVSVDAAT